MKKNKSVTVLGGGAAGLVAAITAAEAGADVTLIERNQMLGRKLLATGNGRCNFSNRHMTAECYHAENCEAVMNVISQFDVEDTAAFLRRFGVAVTDRAGYLYPHSNQASTVQEALTDAVYRAGVNVQMSVTIENITKIDGGFALTGTKAEPDPQAKLPKKHKKSRKPRKLPMIEKSFEAYAGILILTTGGRALPNSGSDGMGIRFAEELGHQVTPPVPALVPLISNASCCTTWQGVRTHGRVTILADDKLLDTAVGELQLTRQGISGIPVFQVSGTVNRALLENKTVTASLDFLPDITLQDVMAVTDENITIRIWLHGLFPEKLCEVLLNKAHIKADMALYQLKKEDVARLEQIIHYFTVTITGNTGYDFAQVTSGGVALADINMQTMASRCVEGLYFAGEIVDVDGLCGGYNLQWAFSSGHLAGLSAAKENKNKK